MILTLAQVTMTFVYGLTICEMWSYKSSGLFTMPLQMIWGISAHFVEIASMHKYP